MSKIYIYIIVFVVGIAVGIWIPRCGSDSKLPPIISKYIQSDTVKTQKPATIYIAETIRKGKEPIIPSIIVPINDSSNWNWDALAIIDSLIGRLDRDSVIVMYRDTQVVDNNIIYLGFNGVSRQFEPTTIQWSEQQEIITRTISIDKTEWYEEPFFVASTSFLVGIGLTILIRTIK